MEFISILWEEPFSAGMLIIGVIALIFAFKYYDLRVKK